MNLIKKYNNDTKKDEHFDLDTDRWLNPNNNKFVVRLRKSKKGEAIGKAVGKTVGTKEKTYEKLEQSNYKIYKFNQIKFDECPQIHERCEIIITKIINKYYASISSQIDNLKGFYEDEDAKYKAEKEVLKANKYVFYYSPIIKSILGKEYKIKMDYLVANKYLKRQVIGDCWELIEDGIPTGMFKKWKRYYYAPGSELLKYNWKKQPVIYNKVYTMVGKLFDKNIDRLGGKDSAHYKNFEQSYNFKFHIKREDFDTITINHYPTYILKKNESIKKNKRKNLTLYKKEYENDITNNDNKNRYFNLLNSKPLSFDEYLKDYEKYWVKMRNWNYMSKWDKIEMYKKDDFSNRLHNIYTSLPSIYIDHQWNYQLDLTTSQFSFFSQLCYNRIGENDFTTMFNQTDDYYMIDGGDRNKNKKNNFKMLFGKTNTKQHKDFCKKYPAVGALVKEIKTDKKLFAEVCGSTSFKKRKIHSNLAYLLQKKELDFFSELWIWLHDNKIQFFSKHDSVILKNFNDYKKTSIKLTELCDKYFTNTKVQIH